MPTQIFERGSLMATGNSGGILENDKSVQWAKAMTLWLPKKWGWVDSWQKQSKFGLLAMAAKKRLMPEVQVALSKVTPTPTSKNWTMFRPPWWQSWDGLGSVGDHPPDSKMCFAYCLVPRTEPTPARWYAFRTACFKMLLQTWLN